MASRPAEDDDYWYMPRTQTPAAGMDVTPDRALTVTTVLSCVRVLAETLAQLPCHVYRRDGNRKIVAEDDPLYTMLHDRPNEWQTAFEFFEMLMGHLTLRGNAYAQIVSGYGGKLEALLPLHPDRVSVKQVDGARGPTLQYKVHRTNGTTDTYLQSDIFHVRGLSSDGIVGLGPIQLAREAVGTAIATERHAAKFFANGAVPGGILEHPSVMGEEGIKTFKREWHGAHSGDNAFNVAILEEGMKYHEVGISNEDSQFLETRKFQVIEICRLFRVPPHMVADLERATFANIEHQSLGFVIYTMGPWIRRWEQAISRDLIDDPTGRFVRFSFEGLLRGDAKARMEFYRGMREIGVYSANDVLELEDRDPIGPIGDLRYVPGNWIEMGKEPPSQPAGNPFGPNPGKAPPADEEDDEEEEAKPSAPDRDQESAIAAMIAATARRMATWEGKAIERRIGKAAEDPQRFVAWLADWSARAHGPYVRSVLEGLIPDAETLDRVTDGIQKSLLASLLHGADPVDARCRFTLSRPDYLTNLLNQELDCALPK